MTRYRQVIGLFAFLWLATGAPLQAAQVSGAPYARDEGALWVAGNDSIEIAISKTSGTILRLLDKVSKEDYCKQSISPFAADSDGNTAMEFELGDRIGGLTLIDELAGREFSDLVDAPRISAVEPRTDGASVSIAFQKLFRGAEFVVSETFRVDAEHIRWNVRIHKTAGKDRTIRVIQFAPLPLGHFQAWAPIADAPFQVKAYVPFAIDYGQSISGAVGEGRWRTNIPMMVFYSVAKKRAISFTSPFEIPSVRIRFLNNTGAGADFHWNSRRYPLRERPYFQVSHEYLGARDKKDIEAGLLISAHPADWRPALGWVYSKYRRYFDGDPNFDPWDGAFVMGYPMMRDSLSAEALKDSYRDKRQKGVRWEELHGHFPWYGLMIPKPDVKTWACESHPVAGTTMSRQKIAGHARLTREFGIGCFLYYNVTEAENWYAQQEFADSVAKSESGRAIGAFRADRFPDKRACWLMNADPQTGFGKHMIRQAREMVEAYPASAGFFWDVYGRSYMFDFAHDDGITMVNNKPAYYPEFMYQRLMRDHIRPLLRSKGMLITANKPVTIVSCEGLDGIMAMEDAPREDSPAWITAQSYLGLNRHMMILDGNIRNVEMMFLHCLRYGMFNTYVSTAGRDEKPLPAEVTGRNRELVTRYRPFIDKFRGKQWIFYPQALELPRHTEGNIFRLKDGSVMITMVSAWKHLRNASSVDRDLEVTCRLPDAAEFRKVEVAAVDTGDSAAVEPQRNGDTLKIKVPIHGKATVIQLWK